MFFFFPLQDFGHGWWDGCLFCMQESAKAALNMKDCQMTDRTTQTEHMGPEVRYTQSTLSHSVRPNALCLSSTEMRSVSECLNLQHHTRRDEAQLLQKSWLQASSFLFLLSFYCLWQCTFCWATAATPPPPVFSVPPLLKTTSHIDLKL